MHSRCAEEIPIDNLIKQLRKAESWSQQDLAERLGVSRQTINAIERERYDPSLELAFKMADVFGQPIEALFKPEGKSNA
jgi:putative transcriptional regulator